MRRIVFEGHPSWRAVLSFYIGGVGGALVIAVILWFAAIAGWPCWCSRCSAPRGRGRPDQAHGDRLHGHQPAPLHPARDPAKKIQQTRIDRVQNVNTEQRSAIACCASAPSTSTPRAPTTPSSASSASPTRRIASVVDEVQRAATTTFDDLTSRTRGQLLDEADDGEQRRPGRPARRARNSSTRSRGRCGAKAEASTPRRPAMLIS